MTVVIGQHYRHYKNGIVYRILLLAVDTETQERMVVYQDTTAPEKIWTRSLELFEADAEWDGKIMKRFTQV